MKKTIQRILAMLMAAILCVSMIPASVFAKDVPLPSPEQGMTRGMFVTVLGNQAGVDKSRYNTSHFADVSPTIPFPG